MSQLLLELVKATMRVHMVLLEVMVARERAQSEEQHPAVNALQKVSHRSAGHEVETTRNDERKACTMPTG